MSLVEYDDYSNINDKVSNLIDWWRTEAHCPDVLPYQHELIDELKQLLESQQVSYSFHPRICYMLAEYCC